MYQLLSASSKVAICFPVSAGSRMLKIAVFFLSRSISVVSYIYRKPVHETDRGRMTVRKAHMRKQKII